MRVDVTTNLDRISRLHRLYYADQLPFAVSQALNDIAKEFQRRQVRAMRRGFTTRNRLFTERAVKIDFANKRQSLIQAVVRIAPPGSPRTADIWAKFEDGGVKRPRGRALAVPVGIRRLKSGRVPDRFRPKALELAGGRGRLGTYVVPGVGIFQRKRRGRYRRRGKLLYLFIQSARVRAALAFEERSVRTYDRHFDRFMARRWARALRTAR